MNKELLFQSLTWDIFTSVVIAVATGGDIVMAVNGDGIVIGVVI